jgi:hypothetical protein
MLGIRPGVGQLGPLTADQACNSRPVEFSALVQGSLVAAPTAGSCSSRPVEFSALVQGSLVAAPTAGSCSSRPVSDFGPAPVLQTLAQGLMRAPISL